MKIWASNYIHSIYYSIFNTHLYFLLTIFKNNFDITQKTEVETRRSNEQHTVTLLEIYQSWNFIGSIGLVFAV